MIEDALTPGKEYEFKLGAKSVPGEVTAVQSRIDLNTLERSEADVLELNEIALCKVELHDTVAIDKYDLCRATGSFIIIDKISNVTVGAGMIREIGENTVKTKAGGDSRRTPRRPPVACCAPAPPPKHAHIV